MNNVLDKKKKAEDLKLYDDLKEKSIQFPGKNVTLHMLKILIRLILLSLDDVFN